MLARHTFTDRRKSCRLGTTTVETAVVLPVFLTLVFGIFEFGHAQLVNNVLNSACRNAARIGAVEGTTTAMVRDKVEQVMGTVVPEGSLDVFIKNASIFDGSNPSNISGSDLEELSDIDLANAEPRTLFVVRARVRYSDIAIVPMPFLKDVVIDAQAFMRRE